MPMTSARKPKRPNLTYYANVEENGVVRVVKCRAPRSARLPNLRATLNALTLRANDGDSEAAARLAEYRRPVCGATAVMA